INEMLGRKKPPARTDLKKIIREQTGQIARQDPDAVALRDQLKRDEKIARTAWREAAKLTREIQKEKDDARRRSQLERQRTAQLEKSAWIKADQLERVKRLRQAFQEARQDSNTFRRMNRKIRNKTMLPEYRNQMVNFLSS